MTPTFCFPSILCSFIIIYCLFSQTLSFLINSAYQSLTKTMNQALKLPKKCLIVLLVIPLTFYYITIYSHSSNDTIEDFQSEYFVEAVSISLSVYTLLIIEVSRLKLQKSKHYSVTVQDFTLYLGFSPKPSNYTKGRALRMFQPR